LAYHAEALDASQKSLNKYNESVAFLNLGKAYHATGEYGKAFDSFASGIRVSREVSHRAVESDCLIGLGETFCETKEYDRMVESFSQALDIAREASLSEYLYKAHLGLSRAHELRGDFAQALAHYKNFFECRRKVFNEEADMKLGRLMVQAELEKAQKEAEIHQLRHVELAARVRELEEALARARHLQGLLSRDTHVYEFGPFRLEAAERRLSRGGRPVQLTAKVFDLLLLLVQNAGHLVKKEEIMRDLWQDVEVEESNITVSVSVLRRALGGGGYIETVPKSGYRFAAVVRHSN
jgi:DNA-binding winged helix-turn-helix (wHTH) protein